MLEVKGLSRHFGGVAALQDVDLRIAASEIVALVGPNGSGKTTLLNVMSGFLPANGGTIVFAGQAIAGLATARIARLGLVRTFQLPAMPRGMSVLELMLCGGMPATGTSIWNNLAHPRRSRRETKREIERAFAILDRMQLSEGASQLAGLLSGGAEEAAEFRHGPDDAAEVLLLDEPTSGVNPKLHADMATQICLLREEEPASSLSNTTWRLSARSANAAWFSIKERSWPIARQANCKAMRGSLRLIWASDLLSQNREPAKRRPMTIELRQVRAGYDRDVDVIRGVSVDVGENEIVAVLGPNGAGKSTLLNAIAGLCFARQGEIRIDGRMANHMPMHERARALGIGYVPQTDNVFGPLSVRENFELGGHFLPPAARRQRVNCSPPIPFLQPRNAKRPPACREASASL